jgi:hypothetical protein
VSRKSELLNSENARTCWPERQTRSGKSLVGLEALAKGQGCGAIQRFCASTGSTAHELLATTCLGFDDTYQSYCDHLAVPHLGRTCLNPRATDIQLPI